MKGRTTDLLKALWARIRGSERQSFLAGGRGRAAKKLALETLENRYVMAAAFFAPPQPTGSVDVQLVPLANVTPGTQEVVTFGVPFTRGSMSQSQLSQVRVLHNGVEIPAFVEQLTPWRSIDDAAIDGQSVRVARIQIPYTFASLNPESITVQWGGPARTLNRPTLQDPRIEWHTVTSGTFVAADNVEEPDVLPVLPKEYLALGMLDARTDPTNSSVAETRDDPAVTDLQTFTGFTEYDTAQKNFFYTIINQNPGITVPYKTDPEPWLYDRSAGVYELYLRSGFATALREAVRSADFYVDHLDSNGFFTLKPGDPKYAYNESLAYTYWLLGDNRMLAPISTVPQAFDGTQTHWTPSLSFWTERNSGDKLLANEMAYEVTGNAAFKSTVQTVVGDLVFLQNGANGQLPANRIDGGLYHTGAQHDISEASSGDVLIASSWMSVLLVDPMVRVFGVWQDNPQIPDFVIRLGNFEKAASKTDADGQFGGTTRYPDYLMRTDGTSDSRSDTDVQHAMDVGGVAAWATYFDELRGTPDASLRQLATDLYSTYDVGVNFWTRPGGTNFNVSPPRRYTWEYKNSASFAWALTGSDAPSQPGTLQFSAANYQVNENQGTAAITVARSGGSTGSVSVNYATSDGSAAAGSDYTPATGTLTFADGETTKSFTIPIINDTAVENPETVLLTLSNPTGGAALASPATATLTINSDDATNQPITVTLQQGVNGYAGTTDADISTQYAEFTGGNGSTGTTGDQLGVYQLPGTSGYTIEGLIRFSDLGITPNATVTSATLTLNVDTWDTPTIRGYYLAAPWTTAPGTDLGWIHRGTGQNWATPGALGQGTDVIAGKSFVIPGITASGPQTRTISLDPAVVQSWINNPSADQGVLLVNETTGAVVRVNTSENATIATRPKLSVTYTVGGQTQQPGAIEFASASYSVSENGGTATITVNRTGGSDGAVSVNYATSNGTATAGADYTAASGVLSFAAGEASKTFTVPILDDAAVENNETVNLVLTNPTGGAVLGNVAAATLTINDNDVAQPGNLQFSAAAYSVNEAQTTATITVTRTGGSDGAVSVNYATSNGTATAGSDYTASSGTLNFAAGETSKTFTIPILDDSAVEGDETVNLTLSSPTGGATLGSQNTAALIITSDDVAQPGSLQFSAAAYTVGESQGTATITVTRSGGSNVPVSVNYATSNGTATAGSDYTAASGTLGFAVGETSKTFTIPIANDTLVEGNETVNLTLSGPTGGATLGSQTTAVLTIADDDTSGQSTTATFRQGLNGYTGTTDASITTQNAQFTAGNGLTSFTGKQMGDYQTTGSGSYIVEDLVRFSNLGIPTDATVSGATLTLSVENWVGSPTIRGYYVLAPWSSTPGSNGSQLGWLHRGTGQDWAAPGALGQGTDVLAGNNFVLPGIAPVGTQNITINLDPAVVQSWINNPAANQGILLVNQSPGLIVQINASENSKATFRPTLSVTYATGTPAPQPGTLQLSNPVVSVNENGGAATITVTRTGGSDGTVGVNFATSNGTATAGSDYTTSGGTLTFAPGETSKTFTIPILNDAVVEGNETVNLVLSSPTGGATLGGQSTAVLTIADDDVAQPGVLQFSAAAFSVNENLGTATVTVTRTGGSNVPVSVNFATSNGTATAGSDYTATSGTLNFAVGETSKTFTIPIANDTLVEGDETVNLTLSSPTGGATLGSQSTAVLTIVDDEVAQPGVLQFSAAAFSVNENQATATITATRTGGSNVPVSVNFATSNGTATAGSDYTATSGTLNFAAGETSKTFTIPIGDDTLVEGDETVNLTLSSPTGGATLGSQTAAVLTIADDDTSSQPTTITLQQGINGYTGTTDASITTQNAQFTSGNGLTDFTSPQLGDYQTTDANSYIVEDLVRFGNLGIPTNSTVSSASLTLSVENWVGSPTIRGYYLLAPWSSTPGPDSSQLGWLHRGTGQDWATPGALGQGTDVIAGNNFVLPGIAPVGTQSIAINLDPAVVQSWINNPAANQGLLLVNESAGAIVHINTSENATAAFRPKLSVTYAVGNGTPQPGTLQLSNPAYSVNENGGAATITVTRTGGSDGAVSVNFATANGTATAGSDYTAASGTLNFAAGETSKTFTVPITNDTAVEGNETISLALSSPTGGASLGGQSTAVLTIQDDDAAPQPGALQFSAGSYSLAENGGSLTVTVTRTGGSAGAVSVNFATSNGTATAGSDYTATSGTLNFAAGETGKTFTVPVLDDTAVEGNEAVTLTLSSPTGGATLGSPASATFTILDNDQATGVTLPTGFTQTTIATGLNSLTAMAAAADGRIFVLEQGGNVRVVKNGALLAAPAITVPTIAEQERGLIGITLDPNFATNHFVYVEYTVGGPTPNPAHNRISRFTLNGDVAVPGSETILLDLPEPTNRIHNGGGMKFGSDGKLYVAVGNDNQFFIAQDLTNPFGKILRINSDGTIPTDNPFFNQPGAYKAIWAYGLRNPYTLDVQPGTGLMYINDVGEASFEEIDQGVAGGNYGWPDSEGYTTNPQFQSPVYAYAHGTGPDQGFAIVGGAFYNPTAATFPSQYVGKYFFADFVNGWISYVDPAAPNPKVATTFATGLPVRFDGGPVDLEVGADGALYYLDRFGGGVFKIQSTAAAQTPSITQQPASQSVTQGQPVTFTVAASGASPLAYQWQKMDNATANFVDISEATSASFTISSTAAADNGDQFRCVVSNAAGSANSSAATLTVTAATSSPTVGAHTLAFVPFNSPAGTLSTSSIATQAAGSTVLAWVGRGNISSFTPANVPTDNRGNTSVQIGATHDYAPNFPNSGFALYGIQSLAGGSGDVFSVPMPVNDEVTLAVVEVKNGGLIQDSQFNKVVNAPQTSLSVTTTGPATLISFWTGDGASGFANAVPDNGFTLLDTQPGSTNSVQAAVATKDVSAAGTYNVTWTTTPPQTAFIWLIAVQKATPAPQPGTLQLSASSYSVSEGQAAATITVNRTGGSDGAVAVNYATSNGTATAGSDYTAASGTLTFAAGETSKTFSVPITNDSAVEGNETINLTLSSPTGGAALGSPATAALTILDNDAPPPVGTFTKINAASGIDAIIAQKYQEDPNWWLTGQHLIDLDNDGDLDLFLDAHNGTPVVALNDGHGVFTRATSGTWPDTEIHEAYDINGDGKVDLAATFEDGGGQWWLNNSTPGHVNFTPTNVTREGNTSRSQVLLDFNGDGKVDWLRSAPPGLVVDFGNGAGGFTENSLTFAIPGTSSNDNASFLPSDFDGDGDIDLLVLTGGNYDGTPGKTAYWRNNGNLTFTDVTATSGIPADGTIAKGVGDFDQDGDTDFIATENKTMPPVVYLNDGHGDFTKKAGAISGVAAGSLDYSFWGTAVTTDFDNDGIADIIMDGKYYLKVLRGTGGGNFTYMNTAWGIKDTAASSVDDGLAFGDIDSDGDLDIIGFDETFPTRTLNVYRNDLSPQNWLNIRPEGLTGNVDAAGAKISIFAAGTNQLLWSEQVAQYDFQVATSYYSYAQTERHFGLGSRTNVDVVVTFASGRVTRLSSVNANQTIHILESDGS